MNLAKTCRQVLTVTLVLFAGFLFACSGAPYSRPDNQEWVERTVLVDGALEISISIPRPFSNRWVKGKMQFIQSEPNELTRIFIASLDPGRGFMDGAAITHIAEYIFRIDTDVVNSGPIDIEDFVQNLYSSHDDTQGEIEFVGSEFIGDEEWYRVNYKGRYSTNSIMYYKPIAENYVIRVSMNVFGDDSEKTFLFHQRQQDLLRSVGSVKVTVADFANQNEE